MKPDLSQPNMSRVFLLLATLGAVRAGDRLALGPEASLKGASRYDDPEGGGHFSELLIDEPRHQLLVGGRDALYRLGLDGLTQLERAGWDPKQSAVSLCTAKGQTEENCRNFIFVRLLLRG